MRQIDTDRLIADYLSGNMNPKDIERLNAIYDSERGWRKFKKRIPAWRKRIPFAVRITATAAVLALAVFFSFSYGLRNAYDNFSDVTVEIPNGSKTTISLPDGTTVLLNGGSRVVYSQGFGITDRNLSLYGEGYFEVERNENLPMRIKSDNISVEVLGTKFSYRDYGNESESYVALTQGSVQVFAGDEMVKLVPGQAAILNPSNSHLTVSEGHNDNFLAWRDGRFIFDETSLASIAEELTRAFGMTFTFESEDLKSLCFYSSFTGPSVSCEHILDYLSATTAFRYEINGKTVTIKR